MGRGANPPDFEGVKGPKHGPKWRQRPPQIQTLDSKLAFLNPLAARIPDQGEVAVPDATTPAPPAGWPFGCFHCSKG